MASTDSLTGADILEAARALAGGSELCLQAVNLMYQAAGGTSVYARSPLDRLFRDAHTVH